MAVWREVAQMQRQRILVAQTDPMGDAALLALGLALGQHGDRLGDLAERHAGAEKLDIRLHLRMRGSKQGGFKRSSQHDLCRLIGETGQAPLRVSSNQASFGAAS